MKLDDLTRHLTREEERELGYKTRKALFIYLLTKKRNAEENKALISCIFSYAFLAIMVIIGIIMFVLLSKESVIDENMMKSFALKIVLLLVITTVLDLFFVGKKWYTYVNTVREEVKKQIDDNLRKL